MKRVGQSYPADLVFSRVYLFKKIRCPSGGALALLNRARINETTGRLVALGLSRPFLGNSAWSKTERKREAGGVAFSSS
jgi:hypothetical protein